MDRGPDWTEVNSLLQTQQWLPLGLKRPMCCFGVRLSHGDTAILHIFFMIFRLHGTAERGRHLHQVGHAVNVTARIWAGRMKGRWVEK